MKPTFWRKKIKSNALIASIYTYFTRTYKIDRVEVDKILGNHKHFNTFVLIDGKGYARFNVEDNVAYILDCIVIDGGVKTIRDMCKIGRQKFPYVDDIKFERYKKGRDMRTFKLKNFTRETI